MIAAVGGRVIVVGGGIAGLVAARACAEAGSRVLLLEAGPVLGGRIAATRVAGIAVDAGAACFSVREGATLALLSALGRGARIVRPAVRSGQAEPSTASLAGGLWTAIPALAADAARRGVQVRLGAGVDALERAPAGARWRLRLRGGERLSADSVLLAVPAAAALPLLAGAGVRVGAHLDTAPGRVDVVTLVVGMPRAGGAGDGMMRLSLSVPASGSPTLTRLSAAWPWLAARVGAGREVLRLSYDGGALLADDALRRQALGDAVRLLGLASVDCPLAGFSRTSWRRESRAQRAALADRTPAVRAALAPLAGLEVAGDWIAGAGVAAVVPDALAAASRIVGAGARSAA